MGFTFKGSGHPPKSDILTYTEVGMNLNGGPLIVPILHV